MRQQHFGSIDEVMAFLRSEVPENPFQGMKNACDYNWVRDSGEGSMRILPSPCAAFSSPFLYRGQTTRYSPCLPGVFRGMPLVDHPQKLLNEDRAKLFLARVRLKEFLAALPYHPAYAYSQELGLAISGEALAQHYEISTDRIDLTQDPEVAAFFATNERDENGTWHPVREGQGVIYRAVISHLRQVLGEEREDTLEWIGKQAWPRPGEQKAWTLQLPLGVDFEKFPVDVLTFDHREICGAEFNKRFAQGRKLFPLDVLSELADQARASPIVDRGQLGEIVKAYQNPGDRFEQELEACMAYLLDHFGVSAEDRGPIRLSPGQMVRALAQTDEMKKTFLSDVGVLAVCRKSPEEVVADRSHLAASPDGSTGEEAGQPVQ